MKELIPNGHIVRSFVEKASRFPDYKVNLMSYLLLRITRPNPFEKYNHENNCIFIHVPRTGGTSIAKSLFNRPGQGHIPLYAYKPHDENAYNEYFKFSFVRNPYSRFVSAFHQVKRDKHSSEWSKRYIGNIDTFEEFTEKLENNFLFRKIILKTCFFRPQWEYIYVGGKIDLDFLGKTERIKKDFDKVRKKINIRCEIKKENESSHKDIESYFDIEKANMVHTMYERDFELFGYDKMYT